MAWLISWMLVPHLGRKTPGIDTILGRKDPNATTRPDGTVVSGDAALLTALLDGPGASSADTDERYRWLSSQMQVQKEEGAPN